MNPVRIVPFLACLFWVFTASGAEMRDLILVAGQSNAVGFDAYADELPADDRDTKVLFWWRCGDPPPDEFDCTSGRRWSHLQAQPRTGPMQGEDAKRVGRQYGNFKKAVGGFGPEIGLARALAAVEQRPLAIVKAAFSGTSVAGDWNVGEAGSKSACYRALLEETRAAVAAAREQGVTLRLRALVWVQGESDANAQNAPAYAVNLARMVARLREDLGAPELPVLLGVNVRFGNGNNPHMPAVIEAQQAVASADGHARYVDTVGAETLPPSHTHFTAVGTLDVGRRYAEALRALEAVVKSR